MRWKLPIVGARVEYIDGEEAAWVQHKETGTIVAFSFADEDKSSPNKWDVAVDWDKEESHRHNCGGKSRSGHGWWVKLPEIRIIF